MAREDSGSERSRGTRMVLPSVVKRGRIEGRAIP